ncbi:hypothetical protein EJ08DRAFT_334846 [Tothia fuscella]|uniref:Uncharacterized protein n=1 Tax=Tothia fuscella TaxID=1048955 RepID=A0A9P4P1T0_9PEZI|nr:hypothetical protein EJ08DRAFT_334846 [Tothia fuscella]
MDAIACEKARRTFHTPNPMSTRPFHEFSIATKQPWVGFLLLFHTLRVWRLRPSYTTLECGLESLFCDALVVQFGCGAALVVLISARPLKALLCRVWNNSYPSGGGSKSYQGTVVGTTNHEVMVAKGQMF